MKQLFFTAIVLLLACSAQAQFQKGNWVLSTTFPFQSEVRTIQRSPTNSKRYERVELVPQLQVGRFVTDRLAIGLQSQYFSQSEGPQFTGGIFLRKYWPITPRFATFLHTHLTFSPNAPGFGKPNRELGLGTQLGFAYFTRKALAIEGKANFLRLAGVQSWNSRERGFRFETNASTFSPSLEMSLAWYFGQKGEIETTNEANRPRIGRGTRTWGGLLRSTLFSSSRDNQSSSVSNLQGGPDYSTFIRDDVAFGIGLNGGFTSANSTATGIDNLNWSVGITPYLRHYRMLNESLGIFLQSSVNVRYTYSEPSKQRYWNADLGIRPGVHYFLGSRWAVEGMAGQVGFSYFRSRIPITDFTNQPITFQSGLLFSNELGLDGFSVGLKYFVR